MGKSDDWVDTTLHASVMLLWAHGGPWRCGTPSITQATGNMITVAIRSQLLPASSSLLPSLPRL